MNQNKTAVFEFFVLKDYTEAHVLCNMMCFMKYFIKIIGPL